MNKINLNYGWEFFPAFRKDYITTFPKGEVVNIPHTNKELPFNNFSEKEFQFVSSYKKEVTINKKENKRYVLEFEGVMTYSEVYVNGEFAVSHKGGYTPFKKDITDMIIDGENTIFVKVDSTERKDIPPFGFVIDYLTYGGIYREVFIYEKEVNFVDNVFVSTRNGELTCRTFLDINEEKELDIKYVIKKDDKVLYEFTETVEAGKEEFVIIEDVELEKWDLDNPVLHTIEVYLDNVLSYTSRFGNREVDFSEKGFFLNYEKVQLYGLNRHQSFPYVGYAMPSNAQRKDADILKYELGVNVVRSSHYPPSKHFLDRCDEIGLLVFNEIPGWQHIGDEAWQAVAIENTKEMIYRDYNHPSIFIWGTRINESKDSDAFYMKTAEIARVFDPSRPSGGVRNFAGSKLFEDVYTYNDFVHRGDNDGLQLRKNVAKAQVPYLITEYNGHMYPTKKFDDEWHRIEHAKRHLNVQNDAFYDDEVAGAIGWCMFDYNTHKDFGSGDRICYHGVMDMFRIPKYAAGVYRSQSDYAPYMQVLSNLNIGEKEASEIKDVIVLTNADYVKFYFNDDFIGDFYPSEEWDFLPHPPVIVDDFIGNMIHENEPYSKKDCDTIKTVLMSIMKHGMNLPFRLKLKMFSFLRRNKLSLDQAAVFYERYVGKWGLASMNYKFEAIKDDEVVETVNLGSTHNHKLVAKADDTILTETETYETTRVVVTHVNTNNNTMFYSNEIISISIEGPLELIGPSNLVLTGGSTGFFLKTTQEKGTALITITNANLEDITLEIEVK